MPKATLLASALIANDDRLRISLLHPIYGRPARVTIVWPPHVTTCTLEEFPQVAADAARLFAIAGTALANIKAHGGDL